mmetsp:Transcript_20372/g.57313  ORF Transcript_20372/g.57313 Transcript_20372/m.57313 type:complete len:285 (+) Transcript_20372:104-958(+)
MSRAGIACFLAFWGVGVTYASRHVGVHNTKASKTGKCQITWKFKDKVLHVSFPVSACRTKCIRTNADSHYDKKFAEHLTATQIGNKCYCARKDTNDTVVSFFGTCEGAQKCWSEYKVQATDTWERQEGRKTLLLTRHQDMYYETKFEYDDPPCDPEGCEGSACESIEIPPVKDCLTTKEKKILGEEMLKLETGEIQEKDMDKDALARIKGLTDEDQAAIFYAGLVPEDGGPATVRDLKRVYHQRLAGSGLSVENLMQVAGLDPVKGLDEILTTDMLLRFLKPSC